MGRKLLPAEKFRDISSEEADTLWGEGRETKLTGFLKSSKIALSILLRASLSSPGKKNEKYILVINYSVMRIWLMYLVDMSTQ